MNDGLRKLRAELHGKLSSLRERLDRAVEQVRSEGTVEQRLAEVRAARRSQAFRMDAARARIRSHLEARLAESEEQLNEWQATHALRPLTARAGRAEEFAADAILIAADALDEAEAAALEAIEARIVADQAAAARL